MNRLPLTKRAQILHLLCEGNSLRSTSRIVGCSFNTVTKLLVDAGTAAREYQDTTLRCLPCKRLQLDEIWSFSYAKARNVPESKRGQLSFGDVWTWTALCADTKLMVSWLAGARDAEYAEAFLDDLAARLANRVQLTTDGHSSYLYAVDATFGGQVDYSVLVKMFGWAHEGQRRDSPPQSIGTKKRRVLAKPANHVSASYVERRNLTVRMMNRRFARLTDAFSKKLENHEHAFALFAMHYNFARVHKTLRVTPAMESGVADHIWSIEEIAELAN